MPDRKKVIYSIERCFCHVPDACRDCAYDAGQPYNECVELLLRDALELLKAQEPRVLTLEEATGEDECWFEQINGSNGYADVYCDWNGAVWVSRINKIMSSMIQEEAYGKQWRCWSARPTDEQRRAVKWDDSD